MSLVWAPRAVRFRILVNVMNARSPEERLSMDYLPMLNRTYLKAKHGIGDPR